MIELQNFYKSYSSPKKDYAVEDVSITIPNGTIAALLGVNGSGKSTIIKAITGFHYPTKGKIFLSDLTGNKISVESDKDKIMEYAGYVPEISILPPDMYVYEFLEYCAKLHSIKDVKIAVDTVVEKCSLSKVLKQKIKTLSKGYKQRVSFAQAIIHNPPNLILDEPISGLDPAQIIQLRKLIEELSKDKAILISTHILQEVYSLCSKVYIINKGKLVIGGTEKEIIEYSKEIDLEKAFLKLSGGSDD